MKPVLVKMPKMCYGMNGGHNVQLALLGAINYALCIGIPSIFEFGEKEYYSRQWEVTADLFGGVESRKHSQQDIIDGILYLRNSKYDIAKAWISIK